MALLPSNISLLRTTASTKRPTAWERCTVGREPPAVWGPAFKLKMEQCFFWFVFICLFGPTELLSLQRSGTRIWPTPLCPTTWHSQSGKVAHPHILSGNWMQRGEGARGLSKPHTSRYLGWFGYFFMKRKTGCWGASIQEIEAKLSLRSEEASFIARL